MLPLRQLFFLVCLARGLFLTSTVTNTDENFQQFIRNVEALVMNTTDRALMVTKNVYLNLNETMPEALRDASKALLESYIQQVDEALGEQATYSEKRMLFQQFRANNRRIEQLRKQFFPQKPEYQFQLISEEFYNTGYNRTEFDNLYLEFIRKFEQESEKLWRNLSEETVEKQEDLLEILDEISNEQKLREKDKLYDEFIEMFLFKSNGDRIENRELDYY